MGMYDGSIYFEITDHKGYVGSLMWFDTNDYTPYCGNRYETAMMWVDSMLYNYNRNLLADADLMPRDIFCLRLIECIDWYGRMAATVPVKSFETEQIVSSYSHSLYEFDHIVDKKLKLTIFKSESDKMKAETDLHVFINFVTKNIRMQNFCKRVKTEVYSKIKETEITDLSVYKAELTEYPTWITNLSFNAIEEAAKLVEDNEKGFKSLVQADFILVK